MDSKIPFEMRPYEEGIKTIPEALGLLNELFEMRPYEEGIKTMVSGEVFTLYFEMNLP